MALCRSACRLSSGTPSWTPGLPCSAAPGLGSPVPSAASSLEGLCVPQPCPKAAAAEGGPSSGSVRYSVVTLSSCVAGRVEPQVPGARISPRMGPVGGALGWGLGHGTDQEVGAGVRAVPVTSAHHLHCQAPRRHPFKVHQAGLSVGVPSTSPPIQEAELPAWGGPLRVSPWWLSPPQGPCWRDGHLGRGSGGRWQNSVTSARGPQHQRAPPLPAAAL